MTQRDAIAFYVCERDASYYSSTGSADGNQSVGKAVNDRGLCRCLSYRVVELEHAGRSAHRFCNNRRQMESCRTLCTFIISASQTQVDVNVQVALVVMCVPISTRKNVPERTSQPKQSQDFMYQVADTRTQTSNTSLRSFALGRRCTYCRLVLIDNQPAM